MLAAAPAPRGAARLPRAPRAQFGVPLPAPPTAVPPRPSPLFARPPALPRTRDPRLLLGLPPDATPAAAVAALHVLTLVYHPNNSAAHEAALQFRALEAACAAVCAGRASFANPLLALHDTAAPHGDASASADGALSPPDAAQHRHADAHAAPAHAATGLVCGACGGGTRRAASTFAAAPAFLCRSCHALNVFAAPGVEVHVHAQQRTAAGVLHFITVDRGCTPSDPLSCEGDDASVHVSYPVFNSSRKVVLGARDAFQPGTRAVARSAGADAGGAAVPLLKRAGCAEAARLPPHAPPLVVRLGGDDGGARVFVERPGGDGAAASGAWDELRDRTAQEHLPAFCAAVMGVAHRGSNGAAELAR